MQHVRRSTAGSKGPAAADALLDAFSGVLAEALDAQGDDVDITDHAVFQQHARNYEADFLRDMDDLGEQSLTTRLPAHWCTCSLYMSSHMAVIRLPAMGQVHQTSPHNGRAGGT